MFLRELLPNLGTESIPYGRVPPSLNMGLTNKESTKRRIHHKDFIFNA